MPGPAPHDIVCVLLAGGQGRRMGGVDKILLPLAGQPVLAHIRHRLEGTSRAVVLNANGDPARFAGQGLPVVADVLPGALGPLAGVLTGMAWAAEAHPDATHLLSVPADVPFLPDDLVPRLAAALADGAEIACARSADRLHPVVALWSLALRDDLRAAVEAGERRIGAWVQGRRLAVVDWPAAPHDPFFNINRPEDLAEAERLM